MSTQDVETRVDLIGLWNAWISYVELFAEKRSQRLQLQEQDYADTHAQLMHACRTELTPTDNPELREQIATIAGPWITLNALKDADQKLLQGVMAECREVDTGFRSRFKVHRRPYQRDRSAPDGPSPSRSRVWRAAPDWMSDAPRPCPASQTAPDRVPPAAI